MNIIPVIRDLLLRNQKATIPGFGTFAIIQKPAQLNKVTRVLSPPKTVISFIQEQKTDDGQLSGNLMQRLKQTREDSLLAIQEFVRDTEKNLKDLKFSRLEGLGTLTLEKSGEISFIPDDELLKRISLFELPKLNIPQPPAEKSEQADLEKTAVSTHKKKWWIPAAAILLLAAGAGYLYYSGLIDRFLSGIQNETSIQSGEENKLVFGQKNAVDSGITDTVIQKISKELDERTSREHALSYNDSKPVTAEAPVSATVENTLVTAGVGYHIIAGAFLVPNNADRFKQALAKKGLDAVILPPQGNYYMISLGSFSTSEEALRAKTDLEKKAGQELWVKKIR